MKYNRMLLAALVLTFAVSVLFSASCKKKEEAPAPEPEKVVFSMVSPSEGQTFHHGDSVFIRFSTSFSTTLHGFEVKIVNESDNDAVVFDKHLHKHGTKIEIDTFWVNNVHHHSDMHLEIGAIKDHEGNKDIKEVHFHCHP